MANNPKHKNGFTAIPHEDMSQILTSDLSGGELKCLFLALRETWGWQRNSFPMGYAGFQRSTRLSRPGVSKALQSLRQRKILTLTEPGNPQHKEATYQISPIDQWQLLTSKETQLVKPSIQNQLKKLTRTSKPQHTELVNTSGVNPPHKEKEIKEIKEKGTTDKVFTNVSQGVNPLKPPTGEAAIKRDKPVFNLYGSPSPLNEKVNTKAHQILEANGYDDVEIDALTPDEADKIIQKIYHQKALTGQATEPPNTRKPRWNNIPAQEYRGNPSQRPAGAFNDLIERDEKEGR